jgi:hypothetical protein
MVMRDVGGGEVGVAAGAWLVAGAPCGARAEEREVSICTLVLFIQL